METCKTSFANKGNYGNKKKLVENWLATAYIKDATAIFKRKRQTGNERKRLDFKLVFLK